MRYEQLFTWLLLVMIVVSGSAMGMPENMPHCGSSTDYYARSLPKPADAKQKQAYIKQLEENRKTFYDKLKNCKWLGGKKPSSMSDFYMIWTPSYDDSEKLKEALQFMHKLQPGLRRELGVFLAIRLSTREDEKKIMSAMAAAGASLPVYYAKHFPNNSYAGYSRSLKRVELHFSSGRDWDENYSFTFPFSELDDSEAEDAYMSTVEDMLRKHAEVTEKALGKGFLSRYMSAYMRTHSTKN